MKYRPEIDGLRAIAVLPVILFHAGVGAVSGGFVGVDVFFVISGYLITTIILSELAAGQFTLLGFYERRARRILPALFLVLAACLPFAWFWLLPGELKDFSQSLMAVASFASNLLFGLKSDYWSTVSQLTPLIHTWSLAVEEQFYVLFPLLVLGLWRFRRTWILAVLLLIAALSLGLAEWGSRQMPNLNFYWLPGRAWELGLGALIAYLSAHRSALATKLTVSATTNDTLAGGGLGLIAYALFAFDKTTPFPSLHGLVPTLGAALILLFASADTWVGRLLASRPLVGIGLISYSAYLWHQPLLAFARHRSLTEPGPGLLSLPVLATFALAYLSWRFVEQPFRHRHGIGRRTLWAFALGGSVFFVTLGAIGHHNQGFSQRVDPRLLANGPMLDCARRQFDPDQICRLNESGSRLALLVGDSHAGMFAHALRAAFAEAGIGLWHISKNACPPILNVYRADRGPVDTLPPNSCVHFNRRLYRYLETHPEIDTVILAARWTLPLEGSRFDNQQGGVESAEYPPRLDLVLDGELKHFPNYPHRALIAQAYRASIEQLLAMGKTVVLIYPVPEAGWSVPKHLHNQQLSLGSAELNSMIGSTSIRVFEQRNRRTHEALDGIGAHPKLIRIRPEQVFCDTQIPERCVVHAGGVPLYRDSHHVSQAGAQRVVEQIIRALR